MKKQPGTAAHSLRDIDLNLLVTLDALLKQGSVTRAAEQLGVSQSAVSHALAKLRQLFGDELFIKSRNKMVATPKATAIGAGIAQVVSMARDVVTREMTFNPAKACRVITIGLDDIGELAILPQLLAGLRRDVPGCVLQTLPADHATLAPMLESGDVDLIITGTQAYTKNGQAGLMQQRLYDHAFTIIAQRQARLGKAMTIEQFCAMDHVALSRPGERTDVLDTLLAAMHIRRTVRLRTPHHLVVPLMIERDPSLIAVVPQFIAQVFSRMTAIRIVQPRFKLPRFSIYQYWHVRFDADPFSRWLRDFIRERVYRHPSLHIE